jgi:hypothetical protein
MFNFDVLVDGRPVKKYYDKSGSIWIEGRKGTAFTLKVKNNDYGRILGIVSVDGLNVIDGKHVPVEESRGYVINSHSNINIPGWKINKSEVREFYFTINGDNSYVRKIGADERNIGVIAAAVYKERVKATWTYTNNYAYGNWPTYDFSGGTIKNPVNVYSSSTTSLGKMRSMNVNPENGSIREQPVTMNWMDEPDMENLSGKIENVSVGSGERVDFRTKTIDFERGDFEGEVLVYYDSWEGLKARGILRDDRNYRERPQPFGTGKFCPDV